MKKIVSVLLLLCLLTGIFGLAAAEGSPKVLDFPKSGFTFTVPDYIENMEGGIFSISDYGETSYKSGIITARRFIWNLWPREPNCSFSSGWRKEKPGKQTSTRWTAPKC